MIAVNASTVAENERKAMVVGWVGQVERPAPPCEVLDDDNRAVVPTFLSLTTGSAMWKTGSSSHAARRLEGEHAVGRRGR